MVHCLELSEGAEQLPSRERVSGFRMLRTAGRPQYQMSPCVALHCKLPHGIALHCKLPHGSRIAH